jgi:hypothetical protein
MSVVRRFPRRMNRAFMIEWMMIFLCGFFVATLLSLMLMSVVHERAVRLTRRRIEESIPESLFEVQIEKDNQRADFAMLVRRLERSVEKLHLEASTARAEVGRKTEAISRLKTELASSIGVADELAHKVKSFTGKIQETERERIRDEVKVFSIEQALSAKEMEFARSATEQRLVVDTQRAEMAALNAQIEQYQSVIDQLLQHADYTAHRPFDEPMETLAIIKELEEEYQTALYLQTSRQIAAEIGTHDFEDASHVFARSGSITPAQKWLGGADG